MALLLLMTIAVSRAEQPTVAAGFTVVVLAPAAAVLIALGVMARRAASRRTGRGQPRLRMPLGALAGGCAVFAVLSTAVGMYLDLRVVNLHPAQPRVIDDRNATIGELGYRSTLEDVRGRLGRPAVARIGDSGFGEPLGADDLVFALGTDADAAWRYRGVAVLVRDEPASQSRRTARGRRYRRQWRPIDSIVISDQDAETRSGVGIGDSLAVARRAYPGIVCDGILYGSDSTNPGDPRCGGRSRDGGAIWFAGDPISTITLTNGSGAEPLDR